MSTRYVHLTPSRCTCSHGKISLTTTPSPVGLPQTFYARVSFIERRRRPSNFLSGMWRWSGRCAVVRYNYKGGKQRIARLKNSLTCQCSDRYDVVHNPMIGWWEQLRSYVMKIAWGPIIIIQVIPVCQCFFAMTRKRWGPTSKCRIWYNLKGTTRLLCRWLHYWTFQDSVLPKPYCIV